MSAKITIVETVPAHLREMCSRMDVHTAETSLRLGIPPNKALWRNYKRSVIIKSAFIDGKLAAIWGCVGTLLSQVGYPWLVMTPEVSVHPHSVAFVYRKEVHKMQGMFPKLVDYVDESNEKAVRMLMLMGFKLNEEQISRNGVVLRCAERVAT
jgi:hypothetical protein